MGRWCLHLLLPRDAAVELLTISATLVIALHCAFPTIARYCAFPYALVFLPAMGIAALLMDDVLTA
jgi:hypothetical protein